MRGNVNGRTQREREIVGRDQELAVVCAFVDDGDRASALVITGEAGAGKTTLWEAGLEAAHGRGAAVLSARPSDVEAQLGFAALTDLFEDLALDRLETLLPPQQRALEVALLRAEPGDAALDRRAIALGALNVIRELAAGAPLLVAIDDVQWLDRPSADALVFAARRLAGDPVQFLLAARVEGERTLEHAFERSAVERLDVGPPSLGATRRLLSQQLDLNVPRQVLRRIHAETLGSPMFVLELGRALRARGPLSVGEDIPDAGDRLSQDDEGTTTRARSCRRVMSSAPARKRLSVHVVNATDRRSRRESA